MKPRGGNWKSDLICAADILDDKYVEVRLSEAFPEAGDGLFANADIPEATIFSLYSGLALTTEQRKTKSEELERWANEQNLTKGDDEVTTHWKYRYDWARGGGGALIAECSKALLLGEILNKRRKIPGLRPAPANAISKKWISSLRR